MRVVSAPFKIKEILNNSEFGLCDDRERERAFAEGGKCCVRRFHARIRYNARVGHATRRRDQTALCVGKTTQRQHELKLRKNV